MKRAKPRAEAASVVSRFKSTQLVIKNEELKAGAISVMSRFKSTELVIKNEELKAGAISVLPGLSRQSTEPVV